MEDTFSRSLAQLFGQVNSPGPRKLLIELLMTVAKCNTEERKAQLYASAQLISKLNAFDAKWVEQPDFNQRLDGFKEVHEMLEKGQVDLDLGVIIIHNCFHFIRTVSIRNESHSGTEFGLIWNTLS
jgi:U3 small nucleolar RNA-associated protein 20